MHLGRAATGAGAKGGCVNPEEVTSSGTFDDGLCDHAAT
jgi:hypothetical protein